MKTVFVFIGLLAASSALAKDVTVIFSDQERLAFDAICERAMIATVPPVNYRDRLQLSQACAHFTAKLDAAANPAPAVPAEKPKDPQD